ncbi:UDP-glycosyltransferase 74G1 [Manihot esculenta]|uniref:Glycosyltransferase n=1 Tax=Manihot esculenta TaxID=3983 RepID=A0A2C9UP63_MANES|nr:UDP-glycosyltransferase 74G1 [Manihot esculenta]OAY32932.1 hypothetical protein MANES_13G056700v8 [Manihot esculenta]
MVKKEMGYKAHALILPYPLQGHINPMLQFSKRLVAKGVKATLAATIFTNKSMHSDPTGSVDIETISDGFDDGGLAQAESTELYLSTLESVGAQTLADLINKLRDLGRPVNVLIYDGFLPWALDVAKRFGLLGVVFFTQPCAVNHIYYHVQRGLLPLPLAEPTVSLPGLPLLQASETPSFVSDSGSYPGFHHLVMNQFRNIDEADWVLYNNFYKLEDQVVEWMAKRWRLRTVGPTLPSMFLDRRLEEDKDYGISLFKPETQICMKWLQDKPKDSVVYVAFGSMAELGAEQMKEIAWGLKASKYYFLWVVRETEKAKLPENFIEETSDKSLVISWCPQLEVLAHEATGCFITHCGFNSVLEALSLGVPLVAMPQWTDQPTNAKFVEDVWKIGIRTWRDEKGIVRRETVELCVRQIMEGQKGKEIREKAKNWMILAKEAISEGGSSDKNIDEFVAQLGSS